MIDSSVSGFRLLIVMISCVDTFVTLGCLVFLQFRGLFLVQQYLGL